MNDDLIIVDGKWVHKTNEAWTRKQAIFRVHEEEERRKEKELQRQRRENGTHARMKAALRKIIEETSDMAARALAEAALPKQRAERHPRQCEVCGAPPSKSDWWHRNSKYCSNECAREGYLRSPAARDRREKANERALRAKGFRDQGMTYPEIGKCLNISAVAARHSVMRAMYNERKDHVGEKQGIEG